MLLSHLVLPVISTYLWHWNPFYILLHFCYSFTPARYVTTTLLYSLAFHFFGALLFHGPRPFAERAFESLRENGEGPVRAPITQRAINLEKMTWSYKNKCLWQVSDPDSRENDKDDFSQTFACCGRHCGPPSQRRGKNLTIQFSRNRALFFYLRVFDKMTPRRWPKSKRPFTGNENTRPKIIFFRDKIDFFRYFWQFRLRRFRSDRNKYWQQNSGFHFFFFVRRRATHSCSPWHHK